MYKGSMILDDVLVAGIIAVIGFIGLVLSSVGNSGTDIVQQGAAAMFTGGCVLAIERLLQHLIPFSTYNQDLEDLKTTIEELSEEVRQLRAKYRE